MFFPAWLPDAIKVVGGLLLIYPALRVSYFAKTYFQFEQIEISNFPSDSFKKYLNDRKEKAFRKQFEWNLIDQLVLFFGLGLVVLGDVLLVIEKVWPHTH